jgi:hypothetical protein
MPQEKLTDTQVGKFLADLGNYRVKRAQQAALLGPSDGISGALLLAIGLKETHLKNIEGGAKKDATGKWVPEDDPTRMDVGWLQISRRFHPLNLAAMAGVRAGTWTPTVAGKTANDGGFCPLFEDSLQFTLSELRDAQDYGRAHGVKDADLVAFAIASHNAGLGGALKGYREGDVDKYTALGDYSSWILSTRTQVNRWLANHPNWTVK